MKAICHSLFAGCLFVLGVWLSQGSVSAQYYNPYPYAFYAQAQYAQQMYNAQYNPYAYNAYAAASAQAQYNQQVWNGQVMSQTYFNSKLGYPNMAANSAYAYPAAVGAALNPGAYGTSYGGAYSGSMGNPYMSTAPGYGVSPGSYSSSSYGGSGFGGGGYGGGGYGNSGYGNSPGYTLMGVADLTRAQGQQMSTIEQARLLREQYNQTKIDTRKKQFELEMYIRANTPSYTEKQTQAARETLKRIQTNSLPGEISNARALNLLLEDLAKHRAKRTSVDPILLGEMVLTHANVTKKTFGLGILRDEGRLTWPGALQELLTPNERKDLDFRITTLVKGAYKGQGVNADMLKDVRSEMDKLTSDLVKKVNEVPTVQYLDAKRFLQEFHEATVALERGEAESQAKFQRFIEGGKTVQDVVEYMLQNGLRFAAATANDEAAYRAIHSALATYDIAVNALSQFTAAKE